MIRSVDIILERAQRAVKTVALVAFNHAATHDEIIIVHGFH